MIIGILHEEWKLRSLTIELDEHDGYADIYTRMK